MQLTNLLIAICLCSAFVAAVDKPVDTTALPSCFTSCASKAATDVGCKDITDATCFCTKENFLEANGRCTMETCGDLASNTTLTKASFSAFETLCKAANGGKFNLTVPTLIQMGMSNSPTVPTSGTTASKHTGASSTDVAPRLSPPMAHVATAAIVLLSLVAGSSLLL